MSSGTWWRNPCGEAQLITGFAHISGAVLSLSSLQKLLKSLRFLGCRLAIRSFISLHRFSMWLRSRDFSHSFVGSVVMFGSVSCWETHLHHPGFWKEKLIHDFAAHGPIHWPLDVVKFCCPFSSGCTFAFLSRGTWWMLQDFNTLLHNVLQIVILVTVVLWSSFGLIHHLSYVHPHPIYWYCFHFWIISPNSYHLVTSFLLMVF